MVCLGVSGPRVLEPSSRASDAREMSREIVPTSSEQKAHRFRV